METLMPGLLALPPRALPFAQSMSARAFHLEREGGNLLVYSVAELEPALRARDVSARSPGSTSTIITRLRPPPTG